MRFLLGVGNYSACDDGIGLRIIEHIAEKGLEKGFCAVDLSSNALNLFSYLDPGAEALLIVDSAKMGGRPGEYRFFEPKAARSRKRLSGLSTHEGDVLRVLELARRMQAPIPSILIMGIEPGSLNPGMRLSDDLERRLPEYASAAIRKLLEMR